MDIIRLNGEAVTSPMNHSASIISISENDHDALQATASLFDGKLDLGSIADSVSAFIEKQEGIIADNNVVAIESGLESSLRM